VLAPSTSPPATPLGAVLDATLVNTNSCLLVTDARTGALLYAHDGDVPLAPASTQKLLVAAAALSRLGPGYRFMTTVMAPRAPVAGAVDDLWIVGGGDPVLASPPYAAYLHTLPATVNYQTTPISALVDGIVAAGVRRVSNGIHGDDSRYEARRTLPTWGPAINRGELDIGPLSALEVDQGLDRWRPASLTVDPAGHAAGVLAALLRARSVAAVQGADTNAPRGGVVLARVQSPPLSSLVASMLQASDNQIAELLVRELDRQAGGSGTTDGGVRVVMSEVAQLGVPTDGLHLVDGSGLSGGARVTCRTLLATLDLGDTPGLSTLSTGLPVAGVDGSLATMFRGTPLAGKLAAKGGYIGGVIALVGRLAVGRPLRFAFVANGPFSFQVGVGLQQRVVDALAA
jgi:D-alanyl-D-alanine carboxypeptidase/D-alanyl-D-alanine-endopeptidase (penicillin-binding protein 4)